MKKAYIIDAKRTPVGKARGLLSKTRADDLLVHAIQSVLKASDPSEKINNSIDDIIVGCAMPEGPLWHGTCLLYTSPSPRDATLSRMPSSA